jgi:hypothetical protein
MIFQELTPKEKKQEQSWSEVNTYTETKESHGSLDNNKNSVS